LSITSISLLLLASSFYPGPGADNVLASEQKKGQGKGPTSPTVWEEEFDIVRRAPAGQPRPRRPVIRAPLLTIEYRVLKKGEDGSPVETNPGAVFYTGDLLQLRFKPNQDGYLHILQHTEGGDGAIIFPETRINEGKNFVKKNEELIVPFNCEEIRKYNCWLIMGPPTGREIFTVIFSREANPAILRLINPKGAEVKLAEISRIKESTSNRTSRPDLQPEKGGGAGRYVIWVTNADRRNNEELVTRFELNHQERSDGR
jgi:hypothetical protein